MPFTWFEPIYPYNIIFDLSNYLLLSLIFFILFKLNIIKKNILFVSLIFLATPFLFNGFLFDWVFLPDQSKYLGTASIFRENPTYFFNEHYHRYGKLKVAIPSFFYAYSPIVSLETYKGISLWNRALFLFSWIFFSKKNFIDEYNSVLMLLSPTLIFSSSIALRENLIILLMLWFLYFFYNKNRISATLVTVVLFFLKVQNIIIIFLFLILNYLIQDYKIKIKLLILIIILFISLTIIFAEELLEVINFYRRGFFVEQYGEYVSQSGKMNYQYFKLSQNSDIFKAVFQSFVNFTLTPFLKGKQSLIHLVLLIEIVIIYLYLYLRITSNKKINFNILFKWALILFLSYLFYSIFVFNDGTILRYKVPVMYFVIFGYFANTKKLKSK